MFHQVLKNSFETCKSIIQLIFDATPQDHVLALLRRLLSVQYKEDQEEAMQYIKVKYEGSARSLQEQCRLHIYRYVAPPRDTNMQTLPLPNLLKTYVAFGKLWNDDTLKFLQSSS